MQSYTVKYILEQQASEQLDAETVFTKLKKWIDKYNSLSLEEQEKLADRENDTFGFYETVPSAFEDLINMEAYGEGSEEYINANKEEIIKNIEEFKEIINQYPELSEEYSEYLDQLEILPIYDMPSGTSTGDTTSPSAPSDDDTDEDKKDDSTSAEEDTYAKDYTGVSIVDFLKQSGKPSDFESRKKLAEELGIKNYTGTAEQNTWMLNTLRRGKTDDAGPSLRQIGISGANAEQPKIPTFKYGDKSYEPYVDMGGGRYVKASPKQIDDPNLQLYIQNPKKGAGEYGKPNFVKMRRERKGKDKDIRPQSQFGGALGSFSNFAGDVGRTLSKPLR